MWRLRKKYLDAGMMACLDALVIALTAFASLYLRFDNADAVQVVWFWQYVDVLWFSLPVLTACYLSALAVTHIYGRVWRYAEMRDYLVLEAACVLGMGMFLLYTRVFEVSFPRSFYVIDLLLTTLLLGISRRLIQTMELRASRSYVEEKKPVLIVGAGDAGVILAREIMKLHTGERRVAGFVDDAPQKQGKRIVGIKVLGGCEDITALVAEYHIRELIIAMPSVPPKDINRIADICKKTSCEVNILPGIYQMIDGSVSVKSLRPLQIEDLLERDPVKLDLKSIAGYLTGKRVLVTGAGGSIGSELCRQVMRMKPAQLVLLGRGENSIYLINQELTEKYGKEKLVPVIANVCNRDRLEDVFRAYRPQVVFHAAAHKHVPLMEVSPKEAVYNNIYGGINVGDVAGRYGVETFITISTDKAVNPTSVMGASKRVVEMVMQVMDNRYATRYVTVRFGNVLGSRGSVVPLFKKQIAAGGPVTVTHPEMKRYFMTIPEASQLVLQAGAMGKGGEVFVLDMGTPVKIVDLAKNMIRLCAGPQQNIPIQFTGLRPGEKLFEELLTAEEGTEATKHKKIFAARLKEVDEESFKAYLAEFANCQTDEEFIAVFKKLIPTYHPNHLGTELVDEKRQSELLESMEEKELQDKLAWEC